MAAVGAQAARHRCSGFVPYDYCRSACRCCVIVCAATVVAAVVYAYAAYAAVIVVCRLSRAAAVLFGYAAALPWLLFAGAANVVTVAGCTSWLCRGCYVCVRCMSLTVVVLCAMALPWLLYSYMRTALIAAVDCAPRLLTWLLFCARLSLPLLPVCRVR